MQNKTFVIVLGIALLGVLIAGACYVVLNNPAPRDLGTPQTTPNTPTAKVPKDTVSYPHDDPNSPYIDLDAKLHVAKYVTLDPEIITINYELKDVELCGETFKTKQIFIDGVDVVQRVADLLARALPDTSVGVCERLEHNATKRFGGRIAQNEELHIMIFKSDINNPDYMAGLSIGKSIKDDLGSWSGSFSIRVSESKDRISFGNEVGQPNITGSLHE